LKEAFDKKEEEESLGGEGIPKEIKIKAARKKG